MNLSTTKYISCERWYRL